METIKTEKDLRNLKVDDLKNICRKYNIRPYYNKNKEELIKFILSYKKEDKPQPREICLELYSENNIPKCETVNLDYEVEEEVINDTVQIEIIPNEISEMVNEDKYVKKYIDYFNAPFVEKMVFRISSENKYEEIPPLIKWKKDTTLDQIHYYTYWKNILIDKNFSYMQVLIYNDGKDCLISFTESQLLDFVETHKLKKYFMTSVCSEFYSDIRCPLLNNMHKPQIMIGETTEKPCNHLHGYYIANRRWLQVIIKGANNKIYDVHFFIDTGSNISFILKETAISLGLIPKFEIGKLSEVYTLNISGVQFNAYLSEESDNPLVNNINLLGTNFLDSFVVTDNYSRQCLTFAPITAGKPISMSRETIKEGRDARKYVFIKEKKKKIV